MKVGITFSTFDLLHSGHIKMLEEAKTQCDYLIIGLQKVVMQVGYFKYTKKKYEME